MTPHEMQTRYADLKRSWEQRQITSEQFQQALAELRYQDSDGTWYQLDSDGRWLRWDGRAWQGASISATSEESQADVRRILPQAPTHFWPLLGHILKLTLKNFFRRIPLALLFCILMVAFTSAVNFYFIVYKDGGYQDLKARPAFGMGTTTIKGTIFGGIILSISTTLLFGLLRNIRKKGISTAVKETLQIPQTVYLYFNRAGPLAKAGLVSGAGMALLMGGLISNFASLAMALGMGTLIFSSARQGLSTLIRSAWDAIFGTLRGEKGREFTLEAGYVVLMGSSLGFILRAYLSSPSSLVLAIVLLVVSLVLVKSGPKAAATAAWILGLPTLLMLLGEMEILLAHDGGRYEPENKNLTLYQYLKTNAAHQCLALALKHGVSTGSAAGVSTVLIQSLLESLKSGLVPDAGRPVLDENGNVLERNEEGRYRWDVGDKTHWLSREEVLERIAEEKDAIRSKEQRRNKFWQDVEEEKTLRRAERDRELKSKGWEYNKELDAYVPGENHEETLAKKAEENARQRERHRENLTEFIRKNVDDSSRANFLENLVDRIAEKGGDMKRLRKAVLDQIWHAERMRDTAEHLDWADYMEAGQKSAEETRDTSRRVNRFLGRFDPTGTAKVINAVQAGLYGVADGYDKTGTLRGTLTAAGAELLDEAMDQTTGLKNIGQALRNQIYCPRCGTNFPPTMTICPNPNCGHNRGKGSILSRFVKDAAYEQVKRYDPSFYAKRFKNAKGAGDYWDILNDMYDTGKSTYQRGSRALEKVKKFSDTHHYTDDSKLPVIKGPVADAPDSPRQVRSMQDETGPLQRTAAEGEGAFAPSSRKTGPGGEEESATRRPGAVLPKEDQDGRYPRRPDETGESRPKPDTIGADKDTHDIRADGKRIGTPDSDGVYDLDMDDTADKSGYAAKYRKGFKPGDHSVPQVYKNDCLAAAVSTATGEPYEKVVEQLRTRGYDEKAGLLKEHFTKTDLESRLPPGVDLESAETKTVDEVMKRLDDGEKIVANFGNHAVTVNKITIKEVDGERKRFVEYTDPSRGKLEVPLDVLEKDSRLDSTQFKNCFFVKQNEFAQEHQAMRDAEKMGDEASADRSAARMFAKNPERFNSMVKDGRIDPQTAERARKINQQIVDEGTAAGINRTKGMGELLSDKGDESIFKSSGDAKPLEVNEEVCKQRGIDPDAARKIAAGHRVDGINERAREVLGDDIGNYSKKTGIRSATQTDDEYDDDPQKRPGKAPEGKRTDITGPSEEEATGRGTPDRKMGDDVTAEPDHADHDLNNPNAAPLGKSGKPYTVYNERNEPIRTIKDPLEASLARHALEKPKDTRWKSFTNTLENAKHFNSENVAQADVPEKDLIKMIKTRDAGRVPYDKLGPNAEPVKHEHEFSVTNMPKENWNLIDPNNPPENPENMRTNNIQGHPLNGFDYYRKPDGSVVYRMYRGLNENDLKGAAASGPPAVEPEVKTFDLDEPVIDSTEPAGEKGPVGRPGGDLSAGPMGTLNEKTLGNDSLRRSMTDGFAARADTFRSPEGDSDPDK